MNLEREERMEEKRSGGCYHDLTISARRTHYRYGIPHRMLRWVAVPPIVTFPDSYGGKIAALLYYQRPDGGKLDIQ